MTDVEICNKALDKFGGETIFSLQGNEPSEKACKRNYFSIRDEVLSAHRWNFATGRRTLSRSGRSPELGYEFAYVLPSDFLETRTVNGYKPGDRREKFAVETDAKGVPVLVTDSEKVNLVYSKRVENPQVFHPLFADAVASKLAAALAPVLSTSRNLRREFIEEYRLVVREAKFRDAIASDDERIDPAEGSMMISSRYGHVISSALPSEF